VKAEDLSGKKSGPQIQDSSGQTFLLVPGLRRDDDERRVGMTMRE